MTWYLQHQRAQDIIAGHEREARRISIEREVRLLEEGRLPATRPARPALAGVRHAIARTMIAIGRSAHRLGEAVDA